MLISVLIGKRLLGFLSMLRNNEVVLLVSAPMLAEFAEVAARDKFRKHFPLDLAHELEYILASLGELVEVEAGSLRPLSRDPKDDYLLLMSRKGKADVLVTGDKDLLTLEHFGATRILTARNFTDEFLS